MAQGSIRELGPGRYQVRVYVSREAGKDRYNTKVVRGTLKDAELERARMLIEASTGQVVTRAGKGSVGELLEEWFRVKSPTWSETTQEFNRGALDRHLLPTLGPTSKRRLTTKQIQAWHASLRRKGLSWAYIKRLNDVLSAALRVAHEEWKELPENPCPRVKVPKHEVAPPELEEALLLAEAAGDERKGKKGQALRARPELARAFGVKACTGLRRGELCGLQVRDLVGLGEGLAELHVRRRVIELRPKSDGTKASRPRRGEGDPDRLVVKELTKGDQPGRRVPLDPDTLELVQAQVDYMRARAEACGGRLRPDAFLFSHEAEGRAPWRPGYLTQEWGRHRARLGEAAAGVRLHDLRHVYASELLAAGVDEVTAASVVGHARPTTTLNIYAHLRRGSNQRVANIMSARVKAARGGKYTVRDVD